MSPPSLTIFFPCFNDSGTIASLVAAADVAAREYCQDYEIIVVDDGSADGSRELLSELQHKYPQLQLVFHHRNKGYGAALLSGFEHARKEWVFYTDGDGQYDVFELRKFLPVIQEGVDVINGYKIFRSDPPHRIIIGKLYLMLIRLLFQFHVRDVDCDFRLIRREALKNIRLHHASGVICLELVKKLELAGYRFVEYPVHHYFRLFGRSQFFNFRRLLVTAINVFSLWWELMVLRRTPVGIAYRQERNRYAVQSPAN